MRIFKFFKVISYFEVKPIDHPSHDIKSSRSVTPIVDWWSLDLHHLCLPLLWFSDFEVEKVKKRERERIGEVEANAEKSNQFLL